MVGELATVEFVTVVDGLAVLQFPTAPHSFSQLLTAVRWLWLLTVGDARTVNAGSAQDLLLEYPIIGIPGSWG